DDQLRICYRLAAQGYPERVEEPPPPGHGLMVLRSVAAGEVPWYVAREGWLSLAALAASAAVAWLAANRWAGRDGTGRAGWWALFWATLFGLASLSKGWLTAAAV